MGIGIGDIVSGDPASLMLTMGIIVGGFCLALYRFMMPHPYLKYMAFFGFGFAIVGFMMQSNCLSGGLSCSL